MTTPPFRIAVVGAGAIGCYYGAKLAASGREVHFLMRGDATEIQRQGIRVRGTSGNVHVAKVNHSATTAAIGPCDLVIVAVKATSNDDLLDLLPPLLHETTMLLTLQNGLGNEEFLANNFGAERVLGGLCFVCLNRVSRGAIDVYDEGYIAIGEFDGDPRPRTDAVAEEFQQSGVVCRVVENLALEHWRKLVWNIPFNGLSITAGGVDTAAILADGELRTTARALMEEVIAAANESGHALPKAAADEQMKRTESMGQYKPSTLMDFEAGRALEIEAIWGEPLRRAAAAGAATPRWNELYASLKRIAAKNAPANLIHG